jgi:hypothetical protein
MSRARPASRKITPAQRAVSAALFAPPEPAPPRGTLWQRMAHLQQTCGGQQAGCPLCLVEMKS